MPRPSIAALNAAKAAKRLRKNASPEIVRQPREDGLRDWKDRGELTRLGTNAYATVRTSPFPTGRLLYNTGSVKLPQLPKARTVLTYPPKKD